MAEFLEYPRLTAADACVLSMQHGTRNCVPNMDRIVADSATVSASQVEEAVHVCALLNQASGKQRPEEYDTTRQRPRSWRASSTSLRLNLHRCATPLPDGWPKECN